MSDGGGYERRRVAETTLAELAWLFARLGLTSFGGPLAHVAMMEDEVVRRRRWLTEQEFLDRIGAANLIPGPNSTELALHIGLERRGILGLLVAGGAFILPAASLSAAFAWAYVRYGTLPSFQWALMGAKPVVLALVVQAFTRLAPRAARSTRLRLLGAFSLVGAWFGLSNLLLLGLAGATGALALRPSDGGSIEQGKANGADRGDSGDVAPTVMALGPLAIAASGVSIGRVFAVFLKIGSMLFGSGYVLLSFLRKELVLRRGWLVESQLLDAVAVGQLTPGPVFSTATFLGFLLAGPAGAAAATVGIFAPAFVLVAVSGPLVPRLRRSRIAAGVLDGVNVASLALMVAVAATLARSTFVDVPSLVTGLVATVLLLRFEVNGSWLVLLGAAAGYLLSFFGSASGVG